MQHILLTGKPLLPGGLEDILPQRLLQELHALQLPCIEELRLRRNKCASVTYGGQNYRLAGVLTGEEMDALLLAFCEGSLYAHGETLCKGYLMLKGGVRVGVCGKASTANGRITGVREIGTYVIRIPQEAPPLGDEICALLTELSLLRGVLIYSPPGVGKTTLLRAVAAKMSAGDPPLRVSVVDTRGELCVGKEKAHQLTDVLVGYPRGIGISIATRTLSAQLIVCDEIGDLAEAQEILYAHSCGVPLLASAHAADLADLLSRPGMRLLHDARVFGAYVRISRHPTRFDFLYDIQTREAADALC